MGNFWDALFKWSRETYGKAKKASGGSTSVPGRSDVLGPPPAPDWYAPRPGSIDASAWRPGEGSVPAAPLPPAPLVRPPDSFIHPVMPVPPAGPIQMPVIPPGGEVVSGNIGAGIPGSFLAQLEELRRRKGQGLGSFGGM